MAQSAANNIDNQGLCKGVTGSDYHKIYHFSYVVVELQPENLGNMNAICKKLKKNDITASVGCVKYFV